MTAEVPVQFRKPETAARIAVVGTSFARLLGRPLAAPAADMIAALWHAPLAVVAHGTEADPLFYFGNRVALAAFKADLEHFIGMPSRLSAEAPMRGERQALLDRVSEQGFIDDYAGVRITLTGDRFRIENAVVWNLVDEVGAIHGQAAAFSV